MGVSEFVDACRAALWLAVEVGSPVMLVALAAGLIIGLVQALTSIQELTLTFVPKLVAIAITIWLTLGASATALVAFFQGPVLSAVVRA